MLGLVVSRSIGTTERYLAQPSALTLVSKVSRSRNSQCMPGVGTRLALHAGTGSFDASGFAACDRSLVTAIRAACL